MPAILPITSNGSSMSFVWSGGCFPICPGRDSYFPCAIVSRPGMRRQPCSWRQSKDFGPTVPLTLTRRTSPCLIAIFKNSSISIRHRNPYIKAFCGLQRKLFLRIAIRKTKSPPGRFSHQRRGNGLSRRQIWSEMKAICKSAGVAESQSLFKVFPHNLRHLFARTFYKVCRAVARLADLLGHSSIETTRIYLISTGVEHTRQLERLNLIC